MTAKRVKSLLIVLAIALITPESAKAQTPTIIYVRKGAAVPGDGTTWAAAYPELTQALSAALGISGTKEIWVANGEYKPNYLLDRNASFILPAETVLIGGFAGNETVKENRDWRKNRTVLSGDLGAMFDMSDNSYHVVVAKDLSSTSGIDGFIIKYGNANGSGGAEHNNSGGGMVIISMTTPSNPSVSNCEFVNNIAAEYGGGLAIISEGTAATSQILNSFFNENRANKGGGAANYSVTGTNAPSFINCSFSTNHSQAEGGAIANISSSASVINSTFSKNNSLLNGGAFYNENGSSVVIKNSILWKNFVGATESVATYNQIYNSGSSPVIQNNIIQGGYGISSDNNIDSDPLFVKEPSFEGKYPRSSVIPVSSTDPKYENMLEFNGPMAWGPWPYYTYRDPVYNKLYMPGRNLQVLDLNNLTNNKPTSTIHYEMNFGKQHHLENSIHTNGNKIYFATNYSGILAVDRQTEQVTVIDPLAGEPVTYEVPRISFLVVDDANELLYCPVQYYTAGYADLLFYGLLELNLVTGVKRWITNSSSSVQISVPMTSFDGSVYYGGYKVLLDETVNKLYFATGNGIWWWNRTSGETGVISTAGGINLKPGNPNLPSNFTTGMYIDHEENKFYIGTYAGLFVWNRNDNTSRVYNKDNSELVDNLINLIDKNSEQNLLYVACEEGGLFILNTVTGEQKILLKDSGNEVNPQLIEHNTASAHYDETDKKLYISTDHWNGGVLIMDYNNLVPDYGDLKLKEGSPAIDKSDSSALPTDITVDIQGLNRRVDYAAIEGVNSLDLGAYEKEFLCLPPAVDFEFEKSIRTLSFAPVLDNSANECEISYSWSFGDGAVSSEAAPQHSYSSSGVYLVRLKVLYACEGCPETEINTEKQITIEEDLCQNIYCHDDNGISVGTVAMAAGYKLSVKGKVVATGARVALQKAWPDYVFHDSYQLRPLNEVKKFIHENGHLPEVPSAEEVANNGMDVGEMSTLMLKKTEELTLYLLQLDERLKKLEKNTGNK